MKRLLVVAALAGTLAACGQAAEESDEPVVAETTAAAIEAAAESSAGTYDVTMPDGSKVTAELKPDGTYEDKDAAGTVVESGTWADRDGKVCFTPANDDPELCFTLGESQGDGTRIATPSDGSEPLTIRKIS